MRRWTKIAILVVTASYLAPLLQIHQLHALETAPRQECADCEVAPPTDERVSEDCRGDGRPCEKPQHPHHHHSPAPHHPGNCQVCSTLARSTPGHPTGEVPPPPPLPIAVHILPGDIAPFQCIRPPVSRGPPDLISHSVGS